MRWYAGLCHAFAGMLLAASAACNASDSVGPATTASATRPVETATAAPSATPVPGAPDGCAPPYPPPATAGAAWCADPAAMQQATVLDIIDGDTLDVLIGGVEERVRLFGVDTPERDDRCYREATALLAALAGSEVRLLPDARNRDSNGRLLRYLYTPQGHGIDATLIAAGVAFAWTRDGALRDALVAIEAGARAGDVGCLWQ